MIRAAYTATPVRMFVPLIFTIFSFFGLKSSFFFCDHNTQKRMKTLENICKPQIVDFLRVCDRRRWVFPRIKYASVRSKPTLLSDIRRHFREESLGPTRLLLVPERPIPVRIEYDFPSKEFLFDGQPIDLPVYAKPTFRILRGPVTVHFGSWTRPDAPPASSVAASPRS